MAQAVFARRPEVTGPAQTFPSANENMGLRCTKGEIVPVTAVIYKGQTQLVC